jgi:hypothetical protein
MKGKAMCLATCDVCNGTMIGHASHIKHVADICSLECFKKLCNGNLGTMLTVKLKSTWGDEEECAEGVIRPFRHRMESFRSDPERQLVDLMKKVKIKWSYEPYVFYLEIKNRLEGYVPDFMTLGTFVEVKGQWTLEGRRKVERFKQVFPWVPLIVLDEVTIADLRREHNAGIRRDRR